MNWKVLDTCTFDYGGVSFTHLLVQSEHSTAYVNPLLWEKYGPDVFSHEGWWKGEVCGKIRPD